MKFPGDKSLTPRQQDYHIVTEFIFDTQDKLIEFANLLATPVKVNPSDTSVNENAVTLDAVLKACNNRSVSSLGKIDCTVFNSDTSNKFALLQLKPLICTGVINHI